MSVTMPVLYVPHGGGPWPWMDVSAFGPAHMYDRLAAWLRGLPATLPVPPKALLVVSAHWETVQPAVLSGSTPPMLYDYTGFPPETYAVQWPAPGAPELAGRVRGLLEQAGIASSEHPSRGFDHGTFVPLALAWPEPQIPTTQLSLQAGLDPARHLAIGRALEPLRSEGVLIVASGMSYHNMRGFFGRVRTIGSDSRAFDEWLTDTVAKPAAPRREALTAWTAAPAARACHPREEHLLPLMVAAGAAGDSAGTVVFRDVIMGATVSGVRFG